MRNKMFEIKNHKGIIALTIGKTIYVHPNLRKYPNLFEYVLSHEMEHVKNHDDIFKDMATDVISSINFMQFFKFMKFIKENPDSILHFLPVNRIEGKFTWCYYDVLSYLIWIVSGVVILTNFLEWIL